MRAYTKIIPGRKHEACDDHLFESIFSDSQNNRCGIFIIGDGLSGSAGHYASNLAVNDLGKRLQEELVKGLSPNDIPSLVKSKFGELDQRVKGKFETTLDSVVIRNETCYLHHAGDSRVYLVYAGGRVEQVTEDEGKISSRLGPANYIGALKGTNEQIIDLKNVQYLFLTTDGLMSRVTDEQIYTLLRTAEYGGLEILGMFEKIIAQPREKLLPIPEEKLVQMIKGKQEKIPQKKQELVDLVLQYYGRDQDVTKEVDSLLEYDDTAMILVDLEDSLGSVLSDEGRRKQTEAVRIQQIEQQRSAVLTQFGELTGKYETEKEARERAEQGLAGLPDVLRNLEQRLGEAVKNNEAYRGQLEALQQRYDADTGSLRAERKQAEEGKGHAEESKRKAETTLDNYTNTVEREKKGFEERIRREEEKKAGGEITKLKESHQKDIEVLTRTNAELGERVKEATVARERAEKERTDLNTKYRDEKVQWGKDETKYRYDLSDYKMKETDWKRKERELTEEEQVYLRRINKLTTDYTAVAKDAEDRKLEKEVLQEEVNKLTEINRRLQKQPDRRKRKNESGSEIKQEVDELNILKKGRSM